MHDLISLSGANLRMNQIAFVYKMIRISLEIPKHGILE
jgi:hypothetical protein